MDEQLSLKHQVMINQFTLATGAPQYEAKEYLKGAGWHYEAALSAFFGQSGIAHQTNHPGRPPANTPATPPAFPDCLANFGKLSTRVAQDGVKTVKCQNVHQGENPQKNCQFTNVTNNNQQKF